MKRVITQILPCDSTRDGIPVGVEEGTSEAPSKSASRQELGDVRIEVIVSDVDADRMVSALLSGRISGAEIIPMRRWVDHELAIAGEDSHDLWHRIVADVERTLITRVFHECHQVKTKAAARLGINRNTLHKKLRQYSLVEEDEIESTDIGPDEPLLENLPGIIPNKT